MYLRACMLTLLIPASVCQVFYFSKTADVFRRTENCQMCYIDHCLSMDVSRCEYYYQADEMIHKHEDISTPDIRMKAGADEKIRADVDAALFDLIDNVSEGTECIPYVSQYTDCTKENICLGCTSCDCDGEGKWNCTETQVCRAENTLNVDHRVLVMVMENLNKYYPRQEDRGFKTKRSVRDDNMNSVTNVNKLTFEELSEWWYGVRPLGEEHDLTTPKLNHNKTEDEAKAVKITTTTPESKRTTTEVYIAPDSENLAFDEVLSNIGIDARSYVRRKLPMDISQNDTVYDYIILDKDGRATHSHNMTPYVPDILSFVDEIDDRIEENQKESKVVIDLLESAKKNNMNIKNATDYMEIAKNNFDMNPQFENTNDIIEYDAVNIMKRDVSNVNATEIVNATTQPPTEMNTRNKTDNICKSNETVISSLNELLTSMQKELEDLQNIKGDLLNFLKSHTKRIANESNNTEKHYFKDDLRKFDIDPRRINQNNLNTILNKLKRDIYEVVRDIIVINKYKGTRDLPDDLKFLINAMKRYVSGKNIKDVKLDKIKLEKNKNLRRYLSKPQHTTSAKIYLIKIFNIIDKQMHNSSALDSLSLATRKIIYRVIKKYYIDDFFATGFRAHESSYNITKYLQGVGNQWQKYALSSEVSSQFQKSYTLKLLHFVLTEDIGKMEDVLSLMNFAHSRRVLPIFRHLEDNIVEKIAKALNAINKKIKLMLDMQNKMAIKPITRVTNKLITPDNVVNPVMKNRQEKKKKSFLKRIRSLLRGSKHNIVDLFERGVPKSEIIKKIARSKMSEIAQKRYDEYEETMRRWQSNLDVNTRRKRSMLDTNGFRARIKNIIPKYLRGKVNGKIDTKKKNSGITHSNKTTKPKSKPKARSGNSKASKSKQKTTVKHKLTTPAINNDY